MILYLCSEQNYDLINFDNVPVKKLSEKRSFKKFIINEARNFSAYSYLIIDLSSLTDTEDEIVEAIMGFKAMYDTSIIILADERDEHLSKLYDAGVRHFITATDSKEIQDEILSCLSNNKIEEKPNLEQVLIGSKLKKFDNVDLNRNFDSYKKGKVIAVAGAAKNVGTTTTALNLAHFLNGMGNKVSYICSSLSSIFPDIENKSSDGFLHQKGVKCYSRDGNLDLSECDYIIMDLNVLNDESLKPFLSADIQILCSTIFFHDIVPEILRQIDGYPINFMFSSVPPGGQAKIRDMVKGYKTYFCEFADDMFDGTANREIWTEIMGITIEKRNKTENQKKTDNSFLDKLKKPELGTGVMETLLKTGEGIKSSFQAQINEKKIKVPDSRSIKTDKVRAITRVIAVAGPAAGLGCTHNILAMAFYLASRGYRVAVAEWSESHDLFVLGHLPNAKQKAENCFKVYGFDVFPRYVNEASVKAERVLRNGYDIVILDLGVIKVNDSTNNVLYEMNRADIPVLIASSSLWRWKDLRHFIDIPGMEHWNLLVSGMNVKELEKQVDNKVYFAPWADPCASNKARDEVFQVLLAPLLISDNSYQKRGLKD